MRLVECDINKVDLKSYKSKCKWLKIIDEFVESDVKCCRIEDYTNKSAASCESSLNHAIKRYNKKGIKAVIRNGEIYLVRIEG